MDKKSQNLESVLMSFLGSADKLKWLLDNKVDLIKYAEDKWPINMAIFDITVKTIPKSKRIKILGEFDFATVLETLQRRRPDLYKVLIECPWGMKWMKRVIEGFKQRFMR